MENFSTLEELINFFAKKYNYEQSGWYKGYRSTHQQVKDDPISESSLELVWYSRDNSVSSLKQGSPSFEDFNASKEILSEISQQIVNAPNSETYIAAQKKLQKAKKDGLMSKMYWALLNRAFAAVTPDSVTTTVDAESFKMVAKYLNKQFGLNIRTNGNWFENNIDFKAEVAKFLPKNYNQFYLNMAYWHTFVELDKEAKERKEQSSSNTFNEPKNIEYDSNLSAPLNQILYGPPGTGKTYHSIQAAVKAAEPEVFKTLGIDESKGATIEQRKELTALYQGLFDQGRIRFVTFHQSYGYEEFVEGLSAKTEGDQLSYFEKDGVFKAICNEAKKNFEDCQKSEEELTDSQIFDEALETFKLTMFDENDTYELTEAVSLISIEDSGFRYSGESWKSAHLMKFEDLKSIFLEGVDTRQGIKKSHKVSGLAKQHASYFIRALDAIKELIPNTITKSAVPEKQNFVLIIDEINRGNISKIFGELITLIEPSKRLGKSEAIEVTLPYSGDKFSVPDNLYIIGTMNTADRSLALMDTALRRRFDFVEMMPEPKLLRGKTVQGIDLEQLLEVMNSRIEVLYDREHTLGHAFFMPVVDLRDGNEDKNIKADEQKAFETLKNVFKNKIIPLLEEYFFEDWNKIRLVLGDNRKNSIWLEHYVFVNKNTQTYNDIFGEQHGLETYEDKKTTYSLTGFNCEKGAWHQPLAYQAIYDPSVFKEATKLSTVEKGENKESSSIEKEEVNA